MKELPEHYPAPVIAEAVPPTERVLDFLIEERGPGEDLLFSLANVLLRKGRTLEALKHYRAALELNPYSPKLRTNLGVSLILLGEKEDAEQQFRQALLQEPALELALLHLGELLEEKKEYEGALKLLERYLQNHPAPKPSLLAGRCAAAVGKEELAEKYFEIAGAAGLEEALSWLIAHDAQRAAAAYDSGDIVECGRVLYRNHERSPGVFSRDRRVQEIVRLLAAKAKPDKRLASLKDAVSDERPGRIYEYLLELYLSLGILAEVFEELHQLTAAEERWAKAIGATRTYPYGNYRHAIILAYKGMFLKALDEFDLCRSKLPEKKQHMLRLKQVVDGVGELREL